MTDQPLVDHDVLADLASQLGDLALVRATVETYLGELGDRVRTLQTSCSTADLALLHRTAHSLKSASMLLGALAIGEAALEVERHSQDPERARAAIPQVEELEHPTREALESWCRTG